MNLFTKQNRPTDTEDKLYGYKGESEGRHKLGDQDEQIHTTIYKIDKQQEPTVQHRELQ